MRKVCGRHIVRPRATRFATNYIVLASLLKKMANLKKSDEWASHKLSRSTVGHEVEGLMFNHAYWENVSNYDAIFQGVNFFF